MSNSLIILPSSYARDNNIIKEKLIDKTPYYKRTKELIALLIDIGALIINPDTGILNFDSFVWFNNIKPNQFIGRLLGYIAEGIVVRDCNESLTSNERWANIARVFKEEPFSVVHGLNEIAIEPLPDNTDEYKAIGTGFAKTSQDYGHLHNPQSNRDICWINKFDDAKELLSVKGVKFNKQKFAGLQIKVSVDEDINYSVVNYFCDKPYFKLYPVVYFDLGDNFYDVQEKLLDIIEVNSRNKKLHPQSILNPDISVDGFSKNEVIEIMLTRGRDVSDDLHEELGYYRSILEKIFYNQINLLDLNNEEIILSLIIEYLARINVMSNNKNQASILIASV